MTISEVWLSIYGFDYQYANTTTQNVMCCGRREDQLVRVNGFNSMYRIPCTYMSRIRGSRFAVDNPWLEGRGGWKKS